MITARILGSVCLALAMPIMAVAQTKTFTSVNTPARATVAGAPTLQIFSGGPQSDLCIGEVSGAYGNSMVAVTVDAPHRDPICALLRQSKWAADLGEPDLGREIMCGSADWRSAAARIGRPCMADAARSARPWWRFW